MKNKTDGKIDRKWAIPLSILACLAIMYVCTVTGIASIPFRDANRILLHEFLHLDVDMEGITDGSITIIRSVRLPRVVLGFLAGASLAVCGAGFQGIFKNPMADPFVLGVSSGAALGAAIGIVLHFGTTLLAFVGAFLTITLVYNISKVGKKVPVATLLLSGIAVSQTLSATMSIIMILNKQSMDQIMFWTMGSLNGKGWGQIITVLPYSLLGIALLLTTCRELDIMLTGEETAIQLGVNVESLKKRVLFASTVITAAVISVTGIIGFVGLVVPHVVRMITGPKHRVLMPLSLLFGGTFLIICDTAARSMAVWEIPVGIITSLCGGPFFIYLLRRMKRGGGL
ncbi:MAG: iron chelate uptake ABC transporter family permease subunit [Lachnospiraceae bacterium]|nr:iron chelate uptake ABC transporter family permease subunit [Lachnospiraceae bacterium]MCI9390263.1 iron chelate uptake ABC transporter family permease subunit [Lachnospiraceae bacterium]